MVLPLPLLRQYFYVSCQRIRWPIIMKGKSLAFYFLIIVLNLFLFIPVFFTFLVLFPIHILIYWLSFDKILSSKSFTSNWSAMKFSVVAFICQWLFIFFALYASNERDLFLQNLLSEPIFFLALGLTVIEFLILYFQYSKFLTKNVGS